MKIRRETGPNKSLQNSVEKNIVSPIIRFDKDVTGNTNKLAISSVEGGNFFIFTTINLYVQYFSLQMHE